jgi:hypothetical protein
MAAKIIRGLANEREAIELARDVHVQHCRNRGNRQRPEDIHTDSSGHVAEDPDNRGTWCLMDKYDVLNGKTDHLEDVATHAKTPSRLKTLLASREDYTEALADKMEPVRVPDPDAVDLDADPITITREEERQVATKVQTEGKTKEDAIREVVASRPPEARIG